MNATTKIFVAYHKPSPIFESDVFVPIHVGAATSSWNSGLLRDDTGDNISAKNQYYCELTALYWVWKNYLPAHPEVRHLGMCHYRRFLDPRIPNPRGQPFSLITTARFSKTFSKLSPQTFESAFASAEIILPNAHNLRKEWLYDRNKETVYSQLVRNGRKTELDELLRLLSSRSTDEQQAVEKVFSDFQFHNCLTFVMSRERFSELAKWLFEILLTMENHPNPAVKSAFMSARVPGFLAERLIDVWLSLENAPEYCEVKSWLLVDETNYFKDKIRPVLKYLRHRPSSALRFGSFSAFK